MPRRSRETSLAILLHMFSHTSTSLLCSSSILWTSGERSSTAPSFLRSFQVFRLFVCSSFSTASLFVRLSVRSFKAASSLLSSIVREVSYVPTSLWISRVVRSATSGCIVSKSM